MGHSLLCQRRCHYWTASMGKEFFVRDSQTLGKSNPVSLSSGIVITALLLGFSLSPSVLGSLVLLLASGVEQPTLTPSSA